MTIKPFLQWIALAVITCGIAILTFVTFQLAEQFIDQAANYAGTISRLIP